MSTHTPPASLAAYLRMHALQACARASRHAQGQVQAAPGITLGADGHPTKTPPTMPKKCNQKLTPTTFAPGNTTTWPA